MIYLSCVTYTYRNYTQMFIIPNGLLPFLLLCLSLGPHIRTVPSSEALASMPASAGFQWTQFTVCLCPSRTATGVSRDLCQMKTLWSTEGMENITPASLEKLTLVMFRGILGK